MRCDMYIVVLYSCGRGQLMRVGCEHMHRTCTCTCMSCSGACRACTALARTAHVVHALHMHYLHMSCIHGTALSAYAGRGPVSHRPRLCPVFVLGIMQCCIKSALCCVLVEHHLRSSARSSVYRMLCMREWVRALGLGAAVWQDLASPWTDLLKS